MAQDKDNQKRAAIEALAPVIQAITGLEFGEVHITVHHGRIVKVERVERLRLGGVADGLASDTATAKGGDR